MKIKSDHIDLADLGYEGYWVEMPKSVKEGFLHEFAKMGQATVTADGEEDTAATVDAGRQTNMKLLELVTAWNIDDDDGNVFPVMAKIKNAKEREKVLSELPIDIIVFLANRITGNLNVSEKTKDF